MSTVDDPGGGSNPESRTTNALPATSHWAGGRNGAESVKMRSFEEIVQDAKTKRNILEINLKKIVDETDSNLKPPNLTFDQFGELIFDRLKISSDDCLRINYASHRYDTRELELKPDVDISKYIKDVDNFYGHSVSVKRQSSKLSRVSFRNVPLNVPDEEIIHLCTHYGKPLNNKVEYERISNPKFGCINGSTRYVEMEIAPGKSFKNFYWMEGPLPGDQGCRITVLHSGQDRQCSNCLKTFREGCPAQGQGKACKELGQKMTRMQDYMLALKTTTGYESLKAAYSNKYPALGHSGKESEIVTNEEIDDDSVKNDNDIIDQKNQEISKLEKELEEHRSSAHVSAQNLHQSKRACELAKNKIATATECLTMYLADNLGKEYFDEFNPVFKFLVSQFSSLLNQPECYSIDPESKDVKLTDTLFVDIAAADSPAAERLVDFKKHLQQKISFDLSVRNERRLSTSMTRARTLSNSTKRAADEPKLGKSKIVRPSLSS